MREAQDRGAGQSGLAAEELQPLLARHHRLERLGDAHRRHEAPFAAERRKRRWARGILGLALRRAPIPAPNVTIGGFSQWAA